jgi:hypothetical protein
MAGASVLARRVLVGIVGVLAIAAVLLVAGELTVRRLRPQSPPDMFTVDPVVGFKLTPNFHGEDVTGGRSVPLVFNSWGLRDREYAARVPGRLRLCILGDSFVFGHGVRAEDTFAKVLERQLQERLGSAAVEVVNAGVPRYGTFQEIGLFEQSVDRIDPDVVVLGVYVGNDVLDNLEFARRREGHGGGPGDNTFTNWLRVRSQLYMWLRRRRHAAVERMDVLQRAAMNGHARTPSAEMSRGIAMTEAAIDHLAALVGARGLRFAVVLIPAAEQVHADRWQRALAHYGLAAEAYDAGEPDRRIAAFVAAHGVAVLDLQPVLARERDQELYFALHWNPRGHALAAVATADFLMASGLLQERPAP